MGRKRSGFGHAPTRRGSEPKSERAAVVVLVRKRSEILPIRQAPAPRVGNAWRHNPHQAHNEFRLQSDRSRSGRYARRLRDGANRSDL